MYLRTRMWSLATPSHKVSKRCQKVVENKSKSLLSSSGTAIVTVELFVRVFRTNTVLLLEIRVANRRGVTRCYQ